MERRARALPGTEGFEPGLETQLAKSLEGQGPGYKPRTHHLNEDGSPKYTNRLILETSPYLLQHAHNPVSWFAWGTEAFETARKLKRPVLLSVGYSTCHWCHVMELESFEDEEIAAYINSHYVPIKVDREERPDVDSVYMTAVQMMNRGGGGWPMTVVMTADGRPFFGGTYFPPRDGARGARIGFLTILQKLNEVFTTEPDKVLESARQVGEVLQAGAKSSPPQGVPGPEALGAAARQLAARFDSAYGGFNGAPKFPRPSTYELLLRYWRRTQDQGALQMVTTSLSAMINGGIYDQIGGGFHRYSTDERWLVPHFEKMLYDNAQLVSVLLDAYQATNDQRFKSIARETLDYVLREMTSPEGGFYSATDADSEGEEGLFFVWKAEEIQAVLGEERSRVISAYFGVTAGGNFEGRNILHRPRPTGEVARELGINEEQLAREVAEAKRLLYEAREKRVHPLRDDKVLTEWNGQMISAFARAGFALDDTRYLEAAKKAGTFVLTQLRTDGRLLRAHRAGRARHGAVLEDYAFFIAGLIDLYEGTGDLRWLEEAIALEKTLEKHYLDAKGGAFFTTADDGEALLVREKPSYDGAQPSGNSIAAMNLLRLAELTEGPNYRRLADGALQALGASLDRGALESPKLAGALDYALDKAKQIIVVTTKTDRGAALLDVVRSTYLPNRVLVVTEEGEPLERTARLIPLVENKRAIGGKATAYVCTERVCQAPTSSPDALRKELALVERLPLSRKLVLPH